MSFTIIIKKKFSRLLENIGYKIVEDNEHNLETVIFKSDIVTIKFVCSPFATEYIYFIKLNTQDIEYENSFVEGYLNLKTEPVFGLKTLNEKVELWATQTHNYFVTFKDTLLTGDKIFFSELNFYFEKICAEYNKKYSS